MKATAVLVHGLFASAAAWDDIVRLVASDADLSDEYEMAPFSYDSKPLRLGPQRRLPDIGDIAGSLRSFLDSLDSERVVFVTHSQGGLVVQRYLVDMLDEQRGKELARIRRIVMLACPNSGSEAFLLLRRGLLLWRHPQERYLRPLTNSVVRTQRRVLWNIASAAALTTTTCPIPLSALAADADNIVVPASALSVWPEVHTVPGDHASIIRPRDHSDVGYTVLKQQLELALDEPYPEPAPTDLEGMASSDVQLGRTQLRSEPPVRLRVGDSDVEFQVHCGPVEQLSDIDIIVLSSNTYLEMSQFFKPSVSGRLRLASCEKGPAGAIVRDVVYEETVAWRKGNGVHGLKMTGGTVMPTSSGALGSRGIRRLYHAAIAEPVAETDGYQVNPHSVGAAVSECFSLAEEEGDDNHGMRSICFPLLGAGRGGLTTRTSLDWMWPSMESALRANPAWCVHLITWKSEQMREISAFLAQVATKRDVVT